VIPLKIYRFAISWRPPHACRAVGRRRALPVLLAAMALSALAVLTPPLAASETIGIELNRLEDQGANCRAYLVITNPGEIAFSGFIFSGSGTITRRLALDLAPLRAAKTSVKVFDITDTACAGIGSILVNDVVDCRDPSGSVAGCVDRISTSSKLAVSLSK
jgi:hypothetical protein